MNIRKEVRDRVFLSLSPQTAQVAGISLQQLQQSTLGGFHLSDKQVADLARHFGIRDEAVSR